jgi:hypothetical protein
VLSAPSRRLSITLVTAMSGTAAAVSAFLLSHRRMTIRGGGDPLSYPGLVPKMRMDSTTPEPSAADAHGILVFGPNGPTEYKVVGAGLRATHAGPPSIVQAIGNTTMT